MRRRAERWPIDRLIADGEMAVDVMADVHHTIRQRLPQSRLISELLRHIETSSLDFWKIFSLTNDFKRNMYGGHCTIKWFRCIFRGFFPRAKKQKIGLFQLEIQWIFYVFEKIRIN